MKPLDSFFCNLLLFFLHLCCHLYIWFVLPFRKRMQLVVNQIYVVVNRTNIDVTNETKALWSINNNKKQRDNVCKYSFPYNADHGFEWVWVWLMGPSSTRTTVSTWWYHNLIVMYARSSIIQIPNRCYIAPWDIVYIYIYSRYIKIPRF